MSDKKHVKAGLSDTEYRKALDRMLDAVFAEADTQDLSNHRLALVAGVSTSTVHLLASGETRYPLLRTIIKLAAALGMAVVLQEARKAKKLRGVA